MRTEQIFCDGCGLPLERDQLIGTVMLRLLNGRQEPISIVTFDDLCQNCWGRVWQAFPSPQGNLREEAKHNVRAGSHVK